jgi:hypothetical protein
MALLAVVNLGCAGTSKGLPRVPVVEPDSRDQAEATLEAFTVATLDPARVAPPAVPAGPHEARDGELRAVVTLIRPEDQEWNSWYGRGARLFNNGVALLLDVHIRGDGPIAWNPRRTRLAVNTEDHLLDPARSPDELLVLLMQAAMLQERHVLDGDLVARTRAAGAFRSAYLPAANGLGELSGVLAFPLDDAEAQIVALRLTLGVDTADGPVELVFDL